MSTESRATRRFRAAFQRPSPSDLAAAALTSAIVVAGPLFSAFLLGRRDLFAPSLLGALFTSRADHGGGPGKRVAAMALEACMLAAGSLIACLAASSPIVLVFAIAAWSFLASALGAFGSLGRRLGSLAVIGFLLMAPTAPPLARALPYCLALIASSALAIALKLTTIAFRPYRSIYEAVAEYCRALASQCDRRGYPGISEGGGPELEDECWTARSEARRLRDLAFLAMRDIDTRRHPAIARARALVLKADSLAIAQVALFEYLRAHSADIPDPLIEPIGEAIEAEGRALEELANAIRRQRTTAVGWVAGLDPELFAGAPAIRGIFKMQARALKGISLCLEAEAPGEAKRDPNGPSAGRPRWDPSALRHSLRLCICLTAATALSLALKIPHGYWMALTAAIVLKPELHASRKRASQRLLGTIAGAALAAAFLCFSPGDATVLGAIAVLAFFAFINYSRNYGLYALFWTPAIVLTLEQGQAGDWMIAAERVANTLAGALLGLVAMYFVMPRWEGDRLSERARALAAAIGRLRRAIPSAEDARPPSPIGAERARLAAYRECLEASSALRRIEEEPRRRRSAVSEHREAILRDRRLFGSLVAASYFTSAP